MHKAYLPQCQQRPQMTKQQKKLARQVELRNRDRRTGIAFLFVDASKRLNPHGLQVKRQEA